MCGIDVLIERRLTAEKQSASSRPQTPTATVTVMSSLLLLSVFFVGLASADIVCFNGDILHKGTITEAKTEETSACRIHFEMMDGECKEDAVDVIASRAGKGVNVTGCEINPEDNMIECECLTEKCNTPNMAIKDLVEALKTNDEKEKKIKDCFVTLLEKKFGLTTTTSTASTTTATKTAAKDNATTVVVVNTTVVPKSSFVIGSICAIVFALVYSI